MHLPSSDFISYPASLRVLSCPMSDLQIATNTFSIDNLIGKGSAGSIYRATLKDGMFPPIGRCMDFTFSSTQMLCIHFYSIHSRFLKTIPLAATGLTLNFLRNGKVDEYFYILKRLILLSLHG